MFSIVSLGSGSSGNSFLVTAGSTRILIDAGIGIRNLQKRLNTLGVDPASLSAIALTHEHTDHSRSAFKMAKRFSVPIAANEDTLRALLPPDVAFPTMVLETGEEYMIGDLRLRAFPVLHDARQPVGYSLQHDGATACLALDLGRVRPQWKGRWQ